MEEDELENRRRLMGFRTPRYRKAENTGTESAFNSDTFAQVAKYGIPLAVLLTGNQKAKQLRKDANVDLEEPELMTGRVRALRRPNFGLRRRDPAGSSLAEMVAGQKFGDAFQRDEEINFEIADEQSRIQQENQVIDRTNQNLMAKNQVRNQEKMIRGNAALQELLGSNVPFQQEALLGLYHNIQSDATQRRYADSIDSQIKSAERSQAAASILMNPGSSEEDRAAARDYFMSTINFKPENKRYGGKFKRRY